MLLAQPRSVISKMPDTAPSVIGSYFHTRGGLTGWAGAAIVFAVHSDCPIKVLNSSVDSGEGEGMKEIKGC